MHMEFIHEDRPANQSFCRNGCMFRNNNVSTRSELITDTLGTRYLYLSDIRGVNLRKWQSIITWYK